MARQMRHRCKVKPWFMLVTTRSDSGRLPPALAGGARGLTYDDKNRGKFQYPKRGRQLLRFDGMNFVRHTSPTDIDAFYEFNNEIFIVFECKYKDAEMAGGQGDSYKKMINRLQHDGAEALLIVCEHSTENCNDDVFLKTCKVRRFYYKLKDEEYHGSLNAFDFAEGFCRKKSPLYRKLYEQEKRGKTYDNA